VLKDRKEKYIVIIGMYGDVIDSDGSGTARPFQRQKRRGEYNRVIEDR
jgi:hypothetical protein